MRSLVWAGAVAIVVISSGVVAGQKRGGPVSPDMIAALPARPPMRPALNPTAVRDRILSFDTNRDDRIARDELPERMEHLVSRGDKNQDGFLTADEIVALLDATPRDPRERTAAFMRAASAVREAEANTIADVIADLKLPPPTHNRAMAIVRGPRNVHVPASVDLEAEMRELLDDEDYLNFVAAVARLRRTPVIVGGIIGGGAGNPASPGASRQPRSLSE